VWETNHDYQMTNCKINYLPYGVNHIILFIIDRSIASKRMYRVFKIKNKTIFKCVGALSLIGGFVDRTRVVDKPKFHMNIEGGYNIY